MTEPFAGRWTGTSRLYLEGEDGPHHESASTLAARPVAGGRFLEVEYTWGHDGRDHEGLILLTAPPAQDAGGGGTASPPTTGAWIDSWHHASAVMPVAGDPWADDRVSVLGSYPVEGHPDWGWRIELAHPGPDGIALTMWNRSPRGEEWLAVRAEYRPAG